MIKFINWLFGFNSKDLSSSEKQKFKKHLNKVVKLAPKDQIIELDKIFHHILQGLGYEGTFGDILKKEPREISNLNEVWELHKLRNTLVHDLREMDERQLSKQAAKYKKVVEKYL